MNMSFSLTLIEAVNDEYGGYLSDDLARAIKFFIENRRQIQIESNGDIVMSDALVPQANQLFASAIRKNGSCPASAGQTGFKFASHARDQIIKYGTKIYAKLS